MNKYIIYCRKSSEQEDRQILSLSAQEDELKEYAQREGLEVVETLQESQSAHWAGRPEFNKMLQKIRGKEVNGIIVWDESRIARNSKDSGEIIYMFDLQQLVEIRKPGKIYRNTPDDKSWLAMCFMMSKKESDDKGVNVKRGLKAKAEKGWLPSGAKAGYMNDKYADKGNKTILPDPERFPIVRKMWDAALTGTYGVMQILRLLNNEWGYRTPKHRKIGGNPMSRSQIYKTLTDPFYYGEFEYPAGSGLWHQGKHNPMVTKEEFDRVQRLLGKDGRPRPRTCFFDYTGLLECGGCHATITAEEKFQIICSSCKHKFASQNKTECPKCKILIGEMKNPTLLHYVYYHCTKRKDPNCTQRSIRVEKLDKELDGTLARLQISERFKNWAVKYLNELSDKEIVETETTLRMLQSAQADYETQLNNLLKLKISPHNANGDLLSDEEYKKQKASLTEAKNKVEEKLGGNNHRAEHWRETAEKTFDFACHARYWFANGDRQTKREILTGLGSNLELYNQSVRINLEKPLSFVELALKEEPTISETFEPENNIDNSVQLEYLWTKNPTLLPRVDSDHEP